MPTGSLGIAVFAATYVLVSVRRLGPLGLDRPAGALLGAVACVVLGVLTPGEAVAAVDGATLLLLLGVMGMGAFLALDGFFEHVEGRLAAVAGTPARLLGLIVWGAGPLAAPIANDAVCVLGAPLVVRTIRRHGLPPLRTGPPGGAVEGLGRRRAGGDGDSVDVDRGHHVDGRGVKTRALTAGAGPTLCRGPRHGSDVRGHVGSRLPAACRAPRGRVTRPVRGGARRFAPPAKRRPPPSPLPPSTPPRSAS